MNLNGRGGSTVLRPRPRPAARPRRPPWKPRARRRRPPRRPRRAAGDGGGRPRPWPEVDGRRPRPPRRGRRPSAVARRRVPRRVPEWRAASAGRRLVRRSSRSRSEHVVVPVVVARGALEVRAAGEGVVELLDERERGAVLRRAHRLPLAGSDVHVVLLEDLHQQAPVIALLVHARRVPVEGVHRHVRGEVVRQDLRDEVAIREVPEGEGRGRVASAEVSARRAGGKGRARGGGGEGDIARERGGRGGVPGSRNGQRPAEMGPKENHGSAPPGMGRERRAPLRVLDRGGELEGEQPLELNARQLAAHPARLHRHLAGRGVVARASGSAHRSGWRFGPPAPIDSRPNP